MDRCRQGGAAGWRVASLAAVVTLLLAVPAGAASVTVGRGTLSPSNDAGHSLCSAGATDGYGSGCNFSIVPTALTSAGSNYVRVPGDGVITTWRVVGYYGASGASSASWTLQRLTRNADGSFTDVADSPGITPAQADGSPVVLATPMPVAPGDYIGVKAALTAPANYAYVSVAGADTPGGAFSRFSSAYAPIAYTDIEPLLNADVTLDPPQAALSPTSGPTAGGQTVTLTGDHLTGASAVSFGGAPATNITVASDTTVTAVTPPHAEGGVDVTVTTPGGTASAGSYTFTGPPAPPPDTTKPVVSSLIVSPTSFQAANSGPAFVAAVGGRVVYRLSEPSRVIFTAQRQARGIKRKGHCVARPRHPHKGAKPCVRYTAVKGSFSQLGTEGLNSLRFMGRLHGHQLAPGRYRLAAIAVDPAGNRSRVVRRAFRVRR